MSSASFSTRLTARGYRFHEFENVFAMPLPAALPASSSIDIRIAADLKVWTRIAAEAFATPEMSVEFLEGVMAPFARRRTRAATGCDVARVTTLPGSDSERNVARRGFELLYTKISLCLECGGHAAALGA